MKKLKRIYLMAVVAMLLAGCSADDLAGTEGQLPISLTAEVEDMDVSTRAGTTVLNAFASGDAFYAYFPTNVRVSTATSASNTTFTLGSGSTWSPATQPYINAGASSATVHAYYPYVSGKQVTNTTSSFSVETDQTTEANYKKSDLMYATATINKGTTTTATGSLTFAHRMAKILVNANIGTGISKITAVKIIGGYRTINISTPQSCTLGTNLSNANSSTNITLYSNSSNASNVSCAGLIPPQTINGNFLQIVTDQGTATYSLSSKQFQSGKSYQLTITANSAALGATNTITGWTSEGQITVRPSVNDFSIFDNRAPAGVEAVDLGIIVDGKRILFANMNVGAETETVCGQQFAWGETTRKGSSYSWDSYKWSAGSKDGSQFSKYVPTSQSSYWGGEGDPDNKLVLDYSDDAARVNWGGDWRMPTKAELEGLLATKSNTTKYTWTWCDGSTKKYKNSIYSGWQVTRNATNATIFLPAEGYIIDSNFTSGSGWGSYWSSTLNEDQPNRVWGLAFNATGSSTGLYNGSGSDIGRCHGRSVRPVMAVLPYTSLSSATSDDVGKVICSNGHIHDTVSDIWDDECYGEGVAVIAYVGGAGDVVDSYRSTYKGLAIALSDVSGTKAWYTANSGTCMSQTNNVSSAVTLKNGIASTNMLTSDGHTHAAASACRSYTPAAPTSYTSNWFLPSMGQWQLIVQGLATKKAGSSVTAPLTNSSNNTYKSSNLNKVITDAGGSGFVTASGTTTIAYWSSTEQSSGNAWCMVISSGGAGNAYKSTTYYVRAVLAF